MNSLTIQPVGRLRYAAAGYLLKLLSLLPARMRRTMMREPVDAALPSFPDFLRLLEVCDPSRHFGWAVLPEKLQAEFPHLASVRVTQIDSAMSGTAVPMRLYRDAAVAPHCGLVWVHGGGFVGGDFNCAEAHWVGLELAKRGVSVLTMDYRKALHGVRFPAPSDDVLTAWNWAVAHAGLFGVGTDRLHIGGGSAGGNLSAGVVKRVRDLGLQAPASALLIYPLLHSSLPPLPPEEEALCRQNIRGYMENAFVQVGALNYVGHPDKLNDPYAFAASGPLHGLPPVYVINAQFDSLRSSGEAFAAKLAAEGGFVRCDREEGAPHGYLQFPNSVFAHSTLTKMMHWLKGDDR